MDVDGRILGDINKSRSCCSSNRGVRKDNKNEDTENSIDFIEYNQQWIKHEPEIIISDDEDFEIEIEDYSRSERKKTPRKNKKKRYNCPNCDRSYGSKHHLTRHIKFHHNPNNQLKCKLCEKVYGRDYDYRIHMMMHKNGGKKPYSCDRCGKGFTRKENLSTHIGIHEGEKKFGCSVCQRRFTRKINRDVHMKVHTEVGKRLSKFLECAHCGKRFVKIANLRSHMQIHISNPKKSRKSAVVPTEH